MVDSFPPADRSTRDFSPSLWPLIVGALIIIGALALFFYRGEWLAVSFGYAEIVTENGDSVEKNAIHWLVSKTEFARDYFIAFASFIGIGLAFWRNFALDRQSKAALEQAEIGNRQVQHDQDRIAGERFSDAVKLLAQKDANEPAIDARIGGIYSLQTLANNRIAEYGAQVVKTLIAYIKQNAQPPLPKETKETRALSKNLRNFVTGASMDSGILNAPLQKKARDMGEDVRTAFKVLEQLLAAREKDSTEWDKAPIGVQLSSEDLNFSGSNFSWLDMSGAPINRLYRYKWNGVNMQGARLAFANLQKADLTFANLESAELLQAKLQNAKLSRANLQGANLTEASLEKARLASANLEGANLASANLHKADLTSANLLGASLAEANLEKARLASANLESADLAFANLHKADLTSAKMQGAVLKKAVLQNAILAYANLNGVVLAKAVLESARLRSAKMQGADLGETIMQNVDLTHTQLQGAVLWEADLQGANLSKADLQYADLSYAKLDDETVLPDNLSGKIWHSEHPELSDITPLAWDAKWDLSPFVESDHALIGILQNYALRREHGFVGATDEDLMRAKKLRIAACKLLDEQKLPKDVLPQNWRDWLAKVNPNGSHPDDSKLSG